LILKKEGERKKKKRKPVQLDHADGKKGGEREKVS